MTAGGYFHELSRRQFSSTQLLHFLSYNLWTLTSNTANRIYKSKHSFYPLCDAAAAHQLDYMLTKAVWTEWLDAVSRFDIHAELCAVVAAERGFA